MWSIRRCFSVLPQLAQTQGNVIDSTIPLLNRFLVSSHSQQTLVEPLIKCFTVGVYRSATSGVARNFVRGGGGGQTNSVEDRGQRERGSGGGSPLVRGSGGVCNLVQEISFHIVKYS